MKEVVFKFSLDQKVTADKFDFTGVITTCAIEGNPESPEIVYFVKAADKVSWFAERHLKGAD